MWDTIREWLGWSVPPRVKIRPSAKVREARAPAPSGRLIVRADQRALWAARGWIRKRGKLVGAFRTPHGSTAGEIVLSRVPEFYLINPPGTLLNGGHGACFRARGNGRYWIHFSRPSADLDAGIVAVEELLAEALGRRTPR